MTKKEKKKQNVKLLNYSNIQKHKTRYKQKKKQDKHNTRY